MLSRIFYAQIRKQRSSTTLQRSLKVCSRLSIDKMIVSDVRLVHGSPFLYDEVDKMKYSVFYGSTSDQLKKKNKFVNHDDSIAKSEPDKNLVQEPVKSRAFGNEEPTDEEIAATERLRKAARNTRTGLLFLGLSTTAGLIWFCFHYGRPRRDENGLLMLDSHTGSILAPVYRIADGFRAWFEYATEPSRDKLLPDPLQAPFHQPKYTIVLEIKNVLVAPEWTYKTGYRFKKRPALEYFLDVVGYPNFELVIYTSEPPMSAMNVVDQFDSKQRIMYRLFRDCTKYMDGHHVKDLSRLNRDLSKVIFIDFDASSAKLNIDNVLRVPKWDGDMNDTALVDLAELLKTIHLSDVADVRPTLQYYSGFDDPAAEFKRRAHEMTTQFPSSHFQSPGLWQKYAQTQSFLSFQRQNAV